VHSRGVAFGREAERGYREGTATTRHGSVFCSFRPGWMRKIQTPSRKAGMVCLLGSLAFEKGCSHDPGKYRWPLLPHWMCTRGARRNQYDVSTDHPRDPVLIGWSRVTIPRSTPGPPNQWAAFGQNQFSDAELLLIM
jgi:hypothetical protein